MYPNPAWTGMILTCSCLSEWAELRTCSGFKDHIFSKCSLCKIQISYLFCYDNFSQHEDWSADVKGSPSDLALIELSSPVEFNDYVQPACLPSEGGDFTVADDCWISGWGDTKGVMCPCLVTD